MAPLSFFDTHIHLDFLPPPDEAGALFRSAAAGFLVPGVNRARWTGLLELASRKGIWSAPGLHPRFSGEWNGAAAAELEGLLVDPRAVAVGEVGLDRHIEVPQDVQERAFREQLRLAVEAGKPALLHCRRATGRLLEILREEGAQRVGGIFHAFSGSLETARQAVGLGFGIGFGGPLTWPEARKGPEVLRELPPEWIVLETDAPDLTPHPHRGEANRPEYLPLVAGKVAEIRGWSLEQTARITTENARRILRIT